MCGRFTLTATPEQIADLLAVDEIEAFPPRYNIAPTQPILLVKVGEGRPAGSNRPNRIAQLARWGLIPFFAKDPKDVPLLINARAETAATKPAFRAAMRHRRCLIPASGFYEWQRRDGRKGQPYLLRRPTSEPFAFAGLMERFMAADGSEIDTAAILTTAANRSLAAIHDRMPVTIPGMDFERWLDCRENGPDDVADLLRPAEDDAFVAVAIGSKVNKVANTGPEIQDPVDVTQEDAALAPSDKPEQPSLF